MSPRDSLETSIITPRKPPLLLLIVATGLGPFSMQVLIPVLPILVGALGRGAAEVQMTLTLYLVGVALGPLLYGPLSDRYGRRPVLIVALVLYLLASVVATFAPNLEVLIVARIAQAVGGCAGMVLGRAIIRDTNTRERAAAMMGYVNMGMTVAPMVSPLIGSLIEAAFGWRAVMLACSLIVLPILFSAWKFLPETLAERQELPGVAGLLGLYKALLVLPSFRAYAMVTACSGGVFFSFMSGAPYVVVHGLGLPTTTYGMAFMSISFAFGLGNFVSARMSAQRGVLQMLRIGTTLTLCGGVLCLVAVMSLPPHLLNLFVPMVIVAIGNGVTQPNAFAGAVSVRPQLAGTASGLAGCVQMGFGAIITWLAALLEDGSGIATASLMFACGIGTQIALAFARRYT